MLPIANFFVKFTHLFHVGEFLGGLRSGLSPVLERLAGASLRARSVLFTNVL